jgi:D-aminopeptidase
MVDVVRAREIGIEIGALRPGPTNSVLDVPGVGLGHATVVRDEPAPPEGRGTARTGVSVLLLAEDAYTRPLAAGGAVLNGAGECTGFLSADEWGAIESPVYLTSTMQLGRVYDAACELALEQHPAVADDVVIPVVAECDDSFLNDCRRMQVTADDVRAAHAAALASRGSHAAPAEGSVGAGTGMSCLGLKGGIGSASRVVESGHTVAVLLLTNFGVLDRLSVAGHPLGRGLRALDTAAGPTRPAGSCIGVVVTDAPVDASACSRLARRVGLGLARTGSTAHHGSGEIFLAASTSCRTDRNGSVSAAADISGRALDPLFEAVVDATEEAVLNSMLQSPTMVGRDGNTSPGLDADVVCRHLGLA